MQQQIPAEINVFLVVLNIFLSIFATLGNVLILVALRKVSSIHPPTKSLIQCLNITDFCNGLICQPLFAIHLLYHHSVLDFNFALLHNEFSLFILLFEVSFLTSAAISVDRLSALLLGLRYRHVVTLFRVRAIIACFWFIAVLNGTLFLVRVKFFFDMNANVGLFWTFFGLVILSVTISTFSNLKIFFTLRRQHAQVQEHVQPGEGRNALNLAQYKKTVTSAVWVHLALLACYGPYTILAMLLWHGIITYTTGVLIMLDFFTSLLFLNSSLNPVLFCWRIRDVRLEVKKIIRKCFCL